MSKQLQSAAKGFLGFSPADWRLIVALSTLQSIAFLPLALAPVYLATLTAELGLSETGAGGLLTLEFLALALTSSLVGSVINRFSLSYLSLLAGGLLVLGNAACVFVADPNSVLFVLLRVMCGCGSGIAMAVAISGVLNVSDSDRAYGIVGAGSFTLSATTLVLASAVLEQGGASYLFALLVGIVLLYTLPSPVLRRSRLPHQTPGDTADTGSLPVLKLGAVYMVFVMLYGLAVNIGWTFSLQMGLATGLSSVDATSWLSANYYLSMPGNLLAAWLGLKYGRSPFFSGLLALGISLWLVFTLQLPEGFMMGQLIFGFFYGLTLPYMYGVGAALDSQGRWAAITPGMFMFSTVISPLLGAYLLEVSGSAWVGWLLVSFLLVAAVVLWQVLSRLPATQPGSEPAINLQSLT
jgi:MFS family permease